MSIRTGSNARNSPLPILLSICRKSARPIAFAGDAFLQCPLTLDHEAFLDSVRELDTDTIPRPGTDIATAIDEAADALRSQPNNMKFLILVSDGEDLEGRVLNAAKNAAQNGLKIYTVGVGTPSGDRIPERNDSGISATIATKAAMSVPGWMKKPCGRSRTSPAAPTRRSGPWQRTRGNLQSLHRAPAKAESRGKRQKIHIERFEWPLAAAILFLIWELMLNERVRSPGPPRVDSAPQPRPRRPAANGVSAGTAIILVLIGAGNLPLNAADIAAAEHAYKAGDYDKSMQEYQQAAESNPARAELQFNRGDAAYRAGEYFEAEIAYHKALETPDLNLQEQSYYNLGNTQYQHGEALRQAGTSKTIKLWEAALHSYECALKLKPAGDTQHNYEVVKRKLEELKQQQPQSGEKDSSDSGQGQSGNAQQGNGKQSGQADAENSSDSRNGSGSPRRQIRPGTTAGCD